MSSSNWIISPEIGMNMKKSLSFTTSFFLEASLTANSRKSLKACHIYLPTPSYLNKKNKITAIWVFPKIGVPQNGWFTMETLLKWMIWRYHITIIFGNTHIFTCHSLRLPIWIRNPSWKIFDERKKVCCPPRVHQSAVFFLAATSWCVTWRNRAVLKEIVIHLHIPSYSLKFLCESWLPGQIV